MGFWTAENATKLHRFTHEITQALPPSSYCMLIQYMKEEITYQWRIKWAGRWTTTRHHCTSDQVRKEHPEAVCLVDTKRVQLIPETKEEFADQMRADSTSGFQRPE
jgi:hypothetical protein